MTANELITRWGALLARPIHYPCRGGWFSKCQDLCYLVLVYGPTSDVAQECAAYYYAGPENDDEVGPQYGGNDEVSMRRVYDRRVTTRRMMARMGV